jgi:uncharacterized protein YciI
VPTFAVTYTYSDDAETRESIRPQHRAYLDGLPELRAAAAYADSPPGGLLIFAADGVERIEEIVADDPYSAAGVITAVGVRQWNPVLGPGCSGLT